MSKLKRREILKAVGLAAMPIASNGCTKTAATRTHRVTTSANRAQVLVLGAGLAGLNCAQTLQEAGIDAVVLEARDDVGGRTRTENHQGLDLNMGGIEVGDGYQRFLSRCEEHNIELYTPHGGHRETALLVNNELIAPEDWASSPHNLLPNELKTVLPNRLHQHIRGKNLPLSSTGHWLEAESSVLDISESEFLRSQGADEISLGLINRTGNFNNLNSVSALHTHRAYANFRYGKSRKTLRIRGGNQRLAKAMAKSLQTVHLNKQAEKIVEYSSGVEVTCRDGSIWLADQLVISLPFSVLRTMQLTAPVTPQQRTAIHSLPYTHISKMMFRVDRAFWDQDGLPANMWCDNIIERGFLSYTESGEPLYTLFVNGAGAEYLDQSQEPHERLSGALFKARPSTRNSLSKLAYYSWGKDPFALGAYHAFGPGQISHFASAMTAPTKRIQFAGEHCARLEPGMEGALESGDLAAQELLKKIKF